MKMNAASIKNQKAEWEALGVKLPAFDHEAMTAKTKEHPVWVHFGAGNIFRAFPAAVLNDALNSGKYDRGVIVAESFDYEIIDKAYQPYDNLSLLVCLKSTGDIDFAAENGIQGVLFEGWNKGWENWGGNQQFDYLEPYADFDLERIAAYAREKGVQLWMHNETGGNILSTKPSWKQR